MSAPPTFLLPPAAYRTESWLTDEVGYIFERSWNLVGDAAVVAENGSFLTAQVGRVPLAVLRGADGVLRAFHNMCRHRGMAMLEGCGHLDGHVRCPYHAWRYGHDGRLELVPQRREQFPDLDTEAWGLVPASVDEWGGMLFVHPDASAPPLSQALGELPAHIGSYRPDLLPQLAAVDLFGDFNWKLFVENHIDIYHLWYLHSQTLNDFDHPRFEHWELGRNWASYEPLRDLDAAVVPAVPIEHIEPRDRLGIGAHMIFPNILMATTAEFFVTYAVVPLNPSRSRIELRVRGEAGANPESLLAAARSFIDEDILACEQVQRVIGSARFEVGPLARGHEASITSFHHHLLDALGAPQ